MGEGQNRAEWRLEGMLGVAHFAGNLRQILTTPLSADTPLYLLRVLQASSVKGLMEG